MTPQRLAHHVAKAAFDKKAFDILILDLRGVTSFTDYFVICSGSSDRQVKAIGDAICAALKAKGRIPLSKEGEKEGIWVLVDFGDVVAHVFHQHERDYYQIERLWSDAPRVAIEGITSEEERCEPAKAAHAGHP